FPGAKAAGLRAVELDPSLGEPHVALGWSSFVFDYDWTTAESQFREALRLSPSLADRRNYALFLVRASRFEEAILEVRRAQALDPLSLEGNMDVGMIYHYARRDAEGLPWIHRTLEM